MFWERKKKRNVVLSRYAFLLFFPLEIAGCCCENSFFWTWAWNCRDKIWILFHPTTLLNIPKHLLARFLCNMKRRPWGDLCPSSPMTSRMLSVNASSLWSCTGLCPQPSLGVGIQKAGLNTPWGAEYGRVPFSESSATWAKTLEAWFYSWIHWPSQLSSAVGVQYFFCSAPGQWKKTAP